MTEPLYEDELEAARAAVKAMGGPKKVGPIFWPDKSVENAGRYLTDCLSHNRAERLTPSQFILLMRRAREMGFHGLAEYVMSDAGYCRPVPVNPQTEAAVIAGQLVEMLDRAERLTGLLQNLKNMGVTG